MIFSMFQAVVLCYYNVRLSLINVILFLTNIIIFYRTNTNLQILAHPQYVKGELNTEYNLFINKFFKFRHSLFL